MDDAETPDERSEEESEEDEGKPKKVQCESMRITYEDPLTSAHRAEEVFLDPRDLWSRGQSLLLVNAAALMALQAKSDKEQSFAISSQSATERARRDYLREQRLLVDELQRLLESDPNMPKTIQGEAQQAIDKAMAVAEQGPDTSQLVFTDSDQRLAVEFYVPHHDIDDEILQHLRQAQVDLGDEVCTRLMVQKVRGFHSDDLRKRESMRATLDELAGSDLASDTGPKDLEGKINLIHSMIIQAQNQGASWTEIGMTIMDAATKKLAQMIEEGSTQNILQETEDVMTDNLRSQYQTLTQNKKEYSAKLNHFYALLAQQEEHAARLMDLQAKAEIAEEKAEIKQAEHQRLTAGYQQRHAAREAKREQVKAERQEKKKVAREEARKEYEALKRDLQAAAAEEASENADPTSVLQLMSQDEKARLQKLEQVVSAFREKQTKMESQIKQLSTEAAEAQTLKEQTRDRVAQAKTMLEQQKKEAERAKKEVAQAEEKKRRMDNEVKELSQKKITFKTQAVDMKTAVPPDVDGMLAKLEADVEKVRGPYQDLCETEQKLLAKEKQLEQRIVECREKVKVQRAEQMGPADGGQHGAQAEAKANAMKETAARADAVARLRNHKSTGYRARLQEEPEWPRHVHLFADQSARDVTLRTRKEEISLKEARDALARMPQLTDEEKEELSRRSQAQAPVWFMRDEDIRVKAALASHSASQLDLALQESNQSLSELKKDLQKCGKRLAEGFSQTAELMSEVPRLARDLQQSLGNEALRRELEAALEAHQECSAQAEDLWHLAEAGCNVGAQQRELELEQSACTQHEEELTRACRRLCDVAGKAGDRSYAAKWSAVEQKLKGLGLRSAWASALEATELLEAEHLCQEKISKQLEQELRRQALLEAELVAPPEAKRALASLRTVTREPQARLLL